MAPRSPLFIFFSNYIYFPSFSYFLHHSALVGDEYLSPHLPSSALCLRRAPRNRPGLEYAGQTVGYNRTPPLPLQHLYDAHNLKQKCRNMHNTPQQHGTHTAHTLGNGGAQEAQRLHWAENERVANNTLHSHISPRISWKLIFLHCHFDSSCDQQA